MENTDFNYLASGIGSGAIFPIQLTTNDKGETGWYPSSGSISLVENNLQGIIQYPIGLKFRQEDFGTRLWELIEEPNTSVTTFLAKEYLKQALYAYESRIAIRRVISTREYTSLNIYCELTLLSTLEEISLSINL